MLSVIIITKNEAHHLASCLESVRFADEIIIVDSGSTDKTVEIAKQYTSHVYEMDWPGYGIQKQRALALARYPWVLNIDADESVSLKLQAAIVKAIREDKADAYRIPIRLQFYGKTLRFSASPSRHIRLFKRAGAAFSEDIVHEKIILPKQSRIRRLRQVILHHSFEDVRHMLRKLDQYSSYSAKMRLGSRKPASMLTAAKGMLWMFLRCYILQGGVFDGRLGFLFACYQAQGSFYRAVKQCYPDKMTSDLPQPYV